MNILTPYGYKNISDVNIGDIVIGNNGVENVILVKRTFNKQWFDEQQLDEWQWYLINGKYKFFRNQNIIVAEGGYNISHVNELKIGWKLYGEGGRYITITSIKKASPLLKWWKLDISGDRSYVVDGIVLHNATRFWVGGGSSTNWNATTNTNWSATSGGSNNATVPGSSDDVTFNGLGGAGNGASIISATITVLSLTFTSGYTNTVTLNAVPTIAGNFTDNTAHSWAGSSGITISAASTITSGGKTFPNGVTFSGTNTKTLSGDWTISGTLTSSGTTVINSGILNIGGGFTNNSGACSGTTLLNFNGTGTWAGSQLLSNSVTINTASTITLSSLGISYSTGTITYISGTIVNTSNVLTLNGSATLNTNGMNWNSITISITSTITINSLLSVTGTLTINAGQAITFAGTAGFTVSTFTVSTADVRTHTLANGLSYTVTTAFNCFLSRNGSIVLFTSDHATLRPTVILNQGAICNVLASFTRIDASNGRSILSFNGTITDSPNIFAYTDIKYLPVWGFPRLNRRKTLSNLNKVVVYE